MKRKLMKIAAGAALFAAFALMHLDSAADETEPGEMPELKARTCYPDPNSGCNSCSGTYIGKAPGPVVFCGLD